MGVTTHNDRATMDKAPREDEEVSFNVATGATYWGGASATVACNTVTVE